MGVKNHQKKIPSPIDEENDLQRVKVCYLESRVRGFCKTCISASEGSYEVNNPLKMTAIITLVGTDDGFKVARPLFFELFTYFWSKVEIFFKFLSINVNKSYEIINPVTLNAIIT